MKTEKNIILLAIVILLISCSTITNMVVPTKENINVEVKSKDLTEVSTAKIQSYNYIFTNEINKVIIDSMDMTALIFLTNKPIKKKQSPNTIVYYDLYKDEVKWSKQTYSNDGTILKNNIIIQGYNKIFALSKESGDIEWEREGSYYFKNDKYNLGFYGLLNAINFETGQDVWSHKITNKFGWIQKEFKDSILYGAVDGLHKFNLNNGTGWDINMSTGRKDVLKAFIINVGITMLDVLMALVSPYSSNMQWVKADIYTAMSSEMLFDQEQIFFSAKENLICADSKTGKIVWQTKLPNNKTANTTLVNNQNYLFLVNKGFCYKNGYYYKYGFPYISQFEKTTGQQLFFKALDDKYPINDIAITSNGYYIITDKMIYNYDFNGNLKTKKDFATPDYYKYGSLNKYIYNPQFYIKENNKFNMINKNELNNSNIFISSSNGILILDSDLVINKWYSNEEICDPIYKNNSTLILEKSILNSKAINSKEIYYIDNNGNSLSSTKINSNIIIFEKSLYHFDSYSLNKILINP